MLKKVLIVIAVIVALLSAGGGLFMFRYHRMVRTIDSEMSTVQDVNLSNIEEGTYRGEFGDFLVHVDLEVTVKDHTISSIEIVRQECGPGYEALETVDRIIDAQSPKVDAVTGATGSSNCIMIATYRALTGTD